MVTKEQALTCRHFIHTATGKNIRKSGKCKVWLKDVTRFKLPVKFGLYNSLYITDTNAHLFEVVL